MLQKIALTLFIAALLALMGLAIANEVQPSSWSMSGSLNYLKTTGYVETSNNKLLYVDGDDKLTELELECLATLSNDYQVSIEFIGDGMNEFR